MTNLPNISVPPQSTGNAANAAQTNNMAVSPFMEGSPRINGAHAGVANPSPSAGDSVPSKDPFAALLARQIGGVDSTSSKIEAATITIDAASSESIDEQAATASSAPSDQAGALAAMLLQLPQELRTQATKDAAGTSTDSKPAAGPDVAARLSASQTDARLDMATVAQGQTDAMPAGADKRNVADIDRQNALKELAAAQNAGKEPVAGQNPLKDQPAQINAQLLASSPVSLAISQALPNMLASNRLPDATQTITTPFGNNGWAEDFSQKISWMSTQKNQVAELHLNPPDLGPLNVVLKISDNQATALFTSPHSAVREALDNAIPRLREILADNGITLGNTTVSDQPPRDRGAEEFLKQGSGPAPLAVNSGDSPASPAASPTTTQVKPLRRHNGMVDTFA